MLSNEEIAARGYRRDNVDSVEEGLVRVADALLWVAAAQTEHTAAMADWMAAIAVSLGMDPEKAEAKMSNTLDSLNENEATANPDTGWHEGPGAAARPRPVRRARPEPAADHVVADPDR